MEIKVFQKAEVTTQWDKTCKVQDDGHLFPWSSYYPEGCDDLWSAWHVLNVQQCLLLGERQGELEVNSRMHLWEPLWGLGKKSGSSTSQLCVCKYLTSQPQFSFTIVTVAVLDLYSMFSVFIWLLYHFCIFYNGLFSYVQSSVHLLENSEWAGAW